MLNFVKPDQTATAEKRHFNEPFSHPQKLFYCSPFTIFLEDLVKVGRLT